MVSNKTLRCKSATFKYKKNQSKGHRPSSPHKLLISSVCGAPAGVRIFQIPVYILFLFASFTAAESGPVIVHIEAVIAHTDTLTSHIQAVAAHAEVVAACIVDVKSTYVM